MSAPDTISVAIEAFVDAQESNRFSLAAGTPNVDPIAIAADEMQSLRAEVAGLRAANQLAVDRAAQAEIARARAIEIADVARLAWMRAQEAMQRLAEVAIEVHKLLPPDALIDRPGEPVVTLGRTRPALLRALGELAKGPP